MPHSDPEDLALVALGEDASPATLEHLDICVLCRDEVATLTDVVDGVRVPAPLQRPPARVWEGIEAQIEQARAAEPIALESRRRRRLPLLLVGAAAAGAAVVLGVQAILPDGGADPAGVELATATLDPLPGWDAAGTAVLEDRDDGRVLRVDLPGDVPVEGYREVWLISTDLTSLVSLGVLTGDSGSFDLPADLDVTEFAVVDVSDEPVNGDPTHSGASIARGELA
ncbi:anti-sigma factor [Serinibacter arcticus]|uniref:Anti-sigma K factor RskA C-terminal domain-containing protein n=1 Tax=Serinibacter arcticus TaxID=1655435 RepID=A0A4Z1E183_9MICO|nr:anti-sigma factor [Serinibacter arcticus]TGO05110.1 hypothetical protein SERN_1114 [Serinibacter arcticus]